MPVPLPVLPVLTAGRTLLLAVLPHGGQLTSRRNAWAALATDAARARARREAALALAQQLDRRAAAAGRPAAAVRQVR